MPNRRLRGRNAAPDEDPRNKSGSTDEPSGGERFREEVQSDDSRQGVRAARGGLPRSRSRFDYHSRDQRFARTGHTGRTGWGRLKIPQRRRLQLMDGIMPGQRHQWRKGALDRNEKDQEPSCGNPPDGCTIASKKPIGLG